MKDAVLDFTIEKPELEEIFPTELPVEQVARYLAALKSEYFRPTMRDEIIVTADTVVILNNRILNKPGDRKEYAFMGLPTHKLYSHLRNWQNMWSY